MGFKAVHDWDGIVADFHAGMPRQQIQEKYGIQRSGLAKGLIARGLAEGTTQTIRRRAQHKANEQALRDAMVPINVDRVEGMAQVAADVITRHRRALYNSQALVDKLKRRLQHAVDNAHEVEADVREYFEAKMNLSPAQAGALRQRMNNALASLAAGEQIDAVKSLSIAEKNYIELERKVYNIDDEGDGENTYEDYLKEMHEKIIARQTAQKLEQRQLALQSEGVASQN